MSKQMCLRIPLAGLENDLDPFVDASLKPYLYQSPSLYRTFETISGAVCYDSSSIILTTNINGIYLASKDITGKEPFK